MHALFNFKTTPKIHFEGPSQFTTLLNVIIHLIVSSEFCAQNIALERIIKRFQV